VRVGALKKVRNKRTAAQLFGMRAYAAAPNNFPLCARTAQSYFTLFGCVWQEKCMADNPVFGIAGTPWRFTAENGVNFREPCHTFCVLSYDGLSAKVFMLRAFF
jgi:hypothetical protein